MRSLLSTLSFVLRHPLNRNRKAAALGRYLRWQIGSRLLPGAAAVPFVGATRLLLRPGMTGGTGNIYCGLHEFADMGFVLHVLRPSDNFADVGANIGSYTILAAGVVGTNCIAVEPIPATFAQLLDNIRLNDLEEKVTARNLGLGARSDSLVFTAGLDTVNHVVAPGEIAGRTITVPVEPLDAVAANYPLAVIKIDVEGFETEVLDGAEQTMRQPTLLAVIVELNGSGRRYGHDEGKIHQRMLRWGFTPAKYDPLQRMLEPLPARDFATGNTLYVREIEELRERIRTAPAFTVLGTSL